MSTRAIDKITTANADTLPLIRLANSSGLEYSMFADGTAFEISCDNIMINLFRGDGFGGGASNLYLRIIEKEKISFVPFLGNPELCRYSCSDNTFTAEGDYRDVSFRATLELHSTEKIWSWNVSLTNNSSTAMQTDLVHFQDLGLADKAAVLNNEYYVSQYVDHEVLQDENEMVLCSRQNLPQGGSHPWLMSGCYPGACGFVTDGFDFYGIEYRLDRQPAALKKKTIGQKRRQYEFSGHGLQSRQISLLPGEQADCSFWLYFMPHHEGVTSHEDLNLLHEIPRDFLVPPLKWHSKKSKALTNNANMFSVSAMLKTVDLSGTEIDELLKTKKLHLEEINGKPLSFFTPEDSHVVLRQKEALALRPHGHILRSGPKLYPDDEMLSCTCWMGGVFASHVSIGNVNFNRFLGLSRGSISFSNTAGLRIFVKSSGGWKMLAVPSAFEMGLGFCRWIYRGEKDLTVTIFVSSDSPEISITVKSDCGEKLELMATSQLVMGCNEFESSFELIADNAVNECWAMPGKDTLFASHYPQAEFYIKAAAPESIVECGSDELLWKNGMSRKMPFAVLQTRACKETTFLLGGSIRKSGNAEFDVSTTQDGVTSGTKFNSNNEAENSEKMWRGFLSGTNFQSSENRNENIDRISSIFPWFAQNAIIHFSKPYGLEQYSSAAWGTRDICQGPFEFLLALGKYADARKVLTCLFSQQYADTGLWPQWFMFDRYSQFRQKECHGDVVIWPLMALCEYIEASNDFTILDEPVAYMESDGKQKGESFTISHHADKIIDTIKNSYVTGTRLVCYGDGDWNDSLQPLDPEMRKSMVSSWTVGLVYQALSKYSAVCRRAGLENKANNLDDETAGIREDFNNHLIKDDVVCGFVRFTEDGEALPLLHPEDKQTGINYRLLPYQRGIISSLLNPEQAQRHLEVINEKLVCPDGVHLTDRPVTYRGGSSKIFKRAESAAFFGREIGTNYIHAHIRYAEALARMGKAEELLQAMLIINPVGLRDVLPGADVRQSNCYYSSSDAAFVDRYKADMEFEKVRSGDINYNGGWRVYSSGPGIYINILISRMLGLRFEFDRFVIDPVLSTKLDGLIFKTVINDREVEFLFSVSSSEREGIALIVNGNKISATQANDNPYRKSGVYVDRDCFLKMLGNKTNIININL